jgi:DNA (cytosine-5)-methyltransferase 1
MNVLSLFDGMSCGQQALERNGIKVDNYFASEIDNYAIKVTMANYPNTKQLGSVVGVDGYSLPNIDLLIGGSPCQSFSFAGRRKGMSTKDEQEIITLDHYLELKNEGFEFEGQSYLFWEYMRLLNEVKPKYFILENVEMGEHWEKVLSKAIGVHGIHINSSLVSAQNRKRIYWTNIGLEPMGLFGFPESIIEQPKDKGIILKDILEDEVDERFILSDKIIKGFEIHSDRHEKKGNNFGFNPKNELDKGNCLRANAAICPTDNMLIVKNTDKLINKGFGVRSGKCRQVVVGDRYVKQINESKESGGQQPYQQNRVYDTDGISPALCANLGGDRSYFVNLPKIRRLTPIECERLQTVKDDYTNHVSISQRYKMLGNGFTVDVICHLLNYIKK